MKTDLLFVQETYIGVEDKKILQNFFKGQKFQALATTKTKGVLIGISSNLEFKVEKMEMDKEGRYIILKGYLDSKVMALVNIYMPIMGNNSNRNFFQKFD